MPSNRPRGSSFQRAVIYQDTHQTVIKLMILTVLKTFPLLLCSLDKILNHKQKKCKQMVKSDKRSSSKKKNKKNPADSNQLATVKLWSKLLAHELCCSGQTKNTHHPTPIILLTTQLHRPAVTIDRKVPHIHTSAHILICEVVQGLICGICGKSSLTHKKIQDNEM